MCIDTNSKFWQDCVKELSQERQTIEEELKNEKKDEEKIMLIRDSVKQVMELLREEKDGIYLDIPFDQEANFKTLITGEPETEEREIQRVDTTLFVEMCKQCGLGVREDDGIIKSEIEKTYRIWL